MRVVLLAGGGAFFLYLLAYLGWKFFLQTETNSTAPVLLFHKVERQREWGVTGLKPDRFKRLLHSLRERGYGSLKLEEFWGDSRSQSRKVLITFDDAYAGIYTQALPILEELGYTASVFVITGFVGNDNSWDLNLGGKRFRHLTWEEIGELAQRGFSFGSHTVTHSDLTKLAPKNMEYELKKSKQDLEDHLGREVAALSYPFGRFNPAVQKEAQRQGYQVCFSIYPGRNQTINQKLAVKRMGVYGLDSPLSLRIKLEGGWWYWLEDLKGYLINRLSLGTTLAKPGPRYLETAS
jgi:peptidoglycan/xylan/chitin deacetylase (PgdA/CDA1 family)